MGGSNPLPASLLTSVVYWEGPPPGVVGSPALQAAADYVCRGSAGPAMQLRGWRSSPRAKQDDADLVIAGPAIRQTMLDQVPFKMAVDDGAPEFALGSPLTTGTVSTSKAPWARSNAACSGSSLTNRPRAHSSTSSMAGAMALAASMTSAPAAV